MIEKDYPILEFDPGSLPVVCASKYLPDFIPENLTDRCLITYFSDVVDQYEREFKLNQAFKIRTEGLRPRVYIMTCKDRKPIYVVPMSIGVTLGVSHHNFMSGGKVLF